MGGWHCKKEVAPLSAMAAVEFATVGVNTLYKAATSKGLSYFVFIAYTYVIGTLVLLPLPFIFRKRDVPSLQPSFLYRIVLLALIGLSANLCAYKGIEYSSPTLSSAASNLTPAFTFVLAVIFRMETLKLRSSITQIKIIGTMLSVFGALVAVLYEGPIIISSSSPQAPSLSLEYLLGTSEKNWVIGGLLLVSQFLLTSVWYILQTQVVKMYPNEIIVVLLYFMCITTMAIPICFIAETNLSAWTLRPDIILVAIVLSGFFGVPFSSFIHTWGLHLKGPLYISIFRPLSIAIAAAVGVIFLGDALCLGSVVGAAILLLGLYAVVWGKAQEDDTMGYDSDKTGDLADNGKTPLLQSCKVEDV
ncbi:Plant-drug/metabolite exporter [Trema orientale]|uniref:WAT1-related protein n=1 Tax=Trema orientale TaxID=63057 RepID=A0A2P5BTB5_TREOI|nr:Plant-drug/metabolite exporter [Trema orientale]